MEVADRCCLRKGKLVGTDVKDTTKEELSRMMVGRDVSFVVDKGEPKPKDVILSVRDLCVQSRIHKKNAVNKVSFDVRQGEIVCLAGIDGNGQSEFVHALTGLEKVSSGSITLNGHDITNLPIRQRSILGMSHIPEDRHKYGLVLDYKLEENLVLQRYWQKDFQRRGFIRFDKVREYAERLIDNYDIRSGQGPITKARSMSGVTSKRQS